MIDLTQWIVVVWLRWRDNGKNKLNVTRGLRGALFHGAMLASIKISDMLRWIKCDDQTGGRVVLSLKEVF